MPAGPHLHAVVADAAVGAARRPVEAAGRAPLHAHLDALDLHRLVERGSEVVLLVLVLLGWRETPAQPRVRHGPAASCLPVHLCHQAQGPAHTPAEEEGLCQALPPNQDPPEPQRPHPGARIYAASMRRSHGLGAAPERRPWAGQGGSSSPRDAPCPGGRRRLHPSRVPSRAALTSREYAGVHEGGHAEVGQHEEEDDGIVGGNDRGDVQAEPGAPAGTGAVGHAGVVPAPAQPGQCHRAPRCPREPAPRTGVAWPGRPHPWLRVRAPAQGLWPFPATKSSPTLSQCPPHANRSCSCTSPTPAVLSHPRGAA